MRADTHTITAAYSGDSNYGPATSSPLSEVVEDFTLTAAGGGTVTVLPQSVAAFQLFVTPVGGATLPGAIGLQFGILPVGATAVFSPASLAASSPATSVTLQVRLAGSSALLSPRPPFGKGAWPLALGLLLAPFGLRCRALGNHLRAALVLAVAFAALAAGLSGCGGNLTGQTFSIPVTAASGGLSHSLTVKLTIQ